jgi:uncharacterized lipoprotein YajG
MLKHRRAIAALLLVTTMALSTGCHSMHKVQPATSPQAPVFGLVRAGDTVSVVLKDGRKARFVVKEITDAALVSPDGTRYSRDEIVELKRRQFSGVKTGFLIGGIAGTAFFLLVAAAIASSFDNLY